MNSRIKILRKTLRLTGETFGSKIGVGRSAISNLEAGNSNPSNQLITSICREFNVNETWLRTGEGEMFNDISREEEITRFVGKLMRNSDDSFKKALILALSQLPEESWLVLEDFVNRIYDEYHNKAAPS